MDDGKKPAEGKKTGNSEFQQALDMVLKTCVSINEAEKQLGIDARRLRALMRERKIVAYKFGSTWLVSKASLDEYARNRSKSKAKITELEDQVAELTAELEKLRATAVV